MEFQDWVSIVCQVGTLVFAALTYFNGKKISRNHGSKLIPIY